jgi:uncharacterized iron-regulated membrane protein
MITAASASHEDENTTGGIIAGSVVGGVLCLLVVGLLVWWIRRRALRQCREKQERGRLDEGAVGVTTRSESEHDSPGRKFVRILLHLFATATLRG